MTGNNQTTPSIQTLTVRGQYVGGMTDMDGDVVQIQFEGTTYNVFLSETFGDEVPDMPTILRTAEAIGDVRTSRFDAEAIRETTRWEFEDCTVVANRDGFDVYMEAGETDEDRGTVVQNVVCGTQWDIAECIAALDCGESPRDAWEDGIGNTVCYANGEVE